MPQPNAAPGTEPAPVAYDRRGAGEPLLLVHGLGSRHQVFDPVFGSLAQRHDVIAVDLPGFGATPLPPGFQPSPVAYAGWLATWLPTISVHRPHVVGNSMGGAIALEMVRRGTAARATAFSPIGFWRRPGRMWCQFLVTTLRMAGRIGGAPVERALALAPARTVAAGALCGRPARVPAATLRADLAALVAAPGFAAARDSFADYTIDFAAELADKDVTVAWGTRDRLLVHRPQSRRARALLRHARHVDLPGCGHIPFNDDPAACVRAILQEDQ